MSGYSNWPSNWATLPDLAAFRAEALVGVDFSREVTLPDDYPRRSDFANRKAFRAALSNWRRGHG